MQKLSVGKDSPVSRKRCNICKQLTDSPHTIRFLLSFTIKSHVYSMFHPVLWIRIRKDPYQFSNLDPHQIKIRIRIRIKIYKLDPDPRQFADVTSKMNGI